MKIKKITVFLLAAAMLAPLFGCGRRADAVDYRDQANWAYYEDAADKPVDVFIICPVVDLGENGNLNMSLDDETLKNNFVGALNMERGIYDGIGNMFAPYYRQITLPVYDLDLEGEEARGAIEIAYRDICDAFERFLKVTGDRPFILAGFSQGSQMGIMLMEDYLDDAKIQKRFVAAYFPGWRVTEEEIAAYPWVKMAQGEDDTGVAVMFNSEAAGVTDSMLVPAGVRTLSINPLNWRTDSTPADKSMNRGACFTDYSASITSEIPELCGGYINEERGTLIVTDVTPEEYPGVLFEDGIYHIYDYQFFYRNLQENVKTRVDAYFAG